MNYFIFFNKIYKNVKIMEIYFITRVITQEQAEWFAYGFGSNCERRVLKCFVKILMKII